MAPCYTTWPQQKSDQRRPGCSGAWSCRCPPAVARNCPRMPRCPRTLTSSGLFRAWPRRPKTRICRPPTRRVCPLCLPARRWSRGMFDKTHTCAGANLSPPLHCGFPQTQSYAVILTDLTRNFIHWAIWDIPADSSALPMGVARVPLPPTPAGAKQVRSYNNTSYGYLGPCPEGVLAHLSPIRSSCRRSALPPCPTSALTQPASRSAPRS